MNLIFNIAYFGILLIVLYPIISYLNTILARLMGRYLNSLFICRWKGSNTYELCFQPAYGFYYARPRSFYKKLSEAIEVFEAGYPDTILIGEMLSSVTAKRQGQIRRCHPLLLFGFKVSADLAILMNLANYRKMKFVTLIAKTHRSDAIIRYQLTGGSHYE
ncbi:hypothetical protein ACE41H_15590 [Paenibacillus enshidis]|uniref:Uncharacterized protein n=1 Tax=Paenibacillus enshidis TaxID=1458439 RepID=A0ABV5AVF6_9BACL